jgi:peptidoglycan/xylan/chitin deacetylase (PgdA/CDA1 family)
VPARTSNGRAGERARQRRLRRLALALSACGALAIAGWAAPASSRPSHKTVWRESRVTRSSGVVTAAPEASSPILHLPARTPTRTLRVPILMYHRIDLVKPTLPPITQRLTVDPTVFAAQMRWLKRHGFHAVTQLQLFEALEYGASLPSRPIMITFDDGYRDVLGKASPVLKRLAIPATAYVITDRISARDPSFLTWGNLRALEQRGITIGSHTVHHLELPSLTDAQVLAELRGSRTLLEQKLGHPVQWFAYPAGAEDTRVVALVRQTGYVLAVTTQPGSSQSGADPLTLHRYEVLDTTGVSGLAAILTG